MARKNATESFMNAASVVNDAARMYVYVSTIGQNNGVSLFSLSHTIGTIRFA